MWAVRKWACDYLCWSGHCVDSSSVGNAHLMLVSDHGSTGPPTYNLQIPHSFFYFTTTISNYFYGCYYSTISILVDPMPFLGLALIDLLPLYAAPAYRPILSFFVATPRAYVYTIHIRISSRKFSFYSLNLWGMTCV